MAGNQNPGYPNVVAGRASSGNTPTDIFMDPTAGALYTGIWVWNASTLAFEKMTQPKTTDNAEVYGYNGTNWHEARIDTSTRSFQTIEYEHHEIHAGSHFFVDGFLDIVGANDVLDFTWQMQASTKWVHWIWSIFTEKAGAWYIYEDAVATNALANTITPFNNNRNIETASITVMKYELQADLTAANADTAIGAATLIASGKLGDNKSGGSDGRNDELVMKQGGLYCLRFIASAAGYVNFKMHWYEHTDKAA